MKALLVLIITLTAVGFYLFPKKAECGWCGSLQCLSSSVCLSDCVCASDGINFGSCVSLSQAEELGWEILK